MRQKIRSRELRQSPRRALALNASILYQELKILKCRTQNIGFGGAAVTTSVSRPPADKEVKFILERQDNQPTLVLNAGILRINGEHIALRFRNIDDGAYRALVDLLFLWQSPHTRPAPVKKRTVPSDLPGGYTFWK